MLAGGQEAFKRVERQKLEALLAFCETSGCRRNILAYFGEKRDERAGTAIRARRADLRRHVEAQKLLSTIMRTGQRFGQVT